MNEQEIRGYSVARQAAFIDEHFAPEVAKQVKESLPDDVREAIPELKAAEWYPRSYSVEILKAIAGAEDAGEEETYRRMVECGKFISSEATSTFLRLLLKILTPTMFAKKVPTFWERDMRGGHFELDVSSARERRIGMKLVDVEGFDHIGAVSAGFIEFGMQAVGEPEAKVLQKGWSKDSPAPAEIEYEITW